MKDAIGKELSDGDEIVLTVHEDSYMIRAKVGGEYIDVGPVEPFYPVIITPNKEVKHS